MFVRIEELSSRYNYEKEKNMSIQKQIARKSAHCCRFTQISEVDAPCVVGKCIVPI
jgi:hypothetical protein